LQDRTDKPTIRQSLDWLGDSEANAPKRIPAPDLLGDQGSLLAEIDRLQVQLGPRDARILQQVINQLPMCSLTATIRSA